MGWLHVVVVTVALTDVGVEPGQVVCVHADSSLEWVVGLLDTLKAEATFCSLDGLCPTIAATV